MTLQRLQIFPWLRFEQRIFRMSSMFYWCFHRCWSGKDRCFTGSERQDQTIFQVFYRIGTSELEQFYWYFTESERQDQSNFSGNFTESEKNSHLWKVLFVIGIALTLLCYIMLCLGRSVLHNILPLEGVCCIIPCLGRNVLYDTMLRQECTAKYYSRSGRSCIIHAMLGKD